MGCQPPIFPQFKKFLNHIFEIGTMIFVAAGDSNAKRERALRAVYFITNF